METIRIEMTREQLDMITRALYAHRMLDKFSKEESWKIEDLADKCADIPTWCQKDGDVYLLTPQEI